MIGCVEMAGHAETVLEVAAVFCAGLSGGLAAVRKRLDVFGVLVLAWATGLGGGILRDLLIGATPPAGISDPVLVITAAVAGVVISLFHPGIAKMRRAIVVLDAGALGLFVVVGTTKGLGHGVGMLAAVFVGTLTGIGGGVLRDLLLGEVPLVLQDRQLYAVPALAGAACVVGLWHQHWLNAETGTAVALGIIAFRLLSLWRGWTVPDPQTAAWPGPWSNGRRG
jgi:uncharacterized membrane protein YeiH